jgi:acyl-CoA synthetase (AMP-forming)/AMP-acid ligase II
MPKQEVLAREIPPPAERRRAIEAEPLPANLGALLDATADAVPDQTALIFIEDGTILTYGALRSAVNRVANNLRGIGVRKGVHVGVMLPNIAAFPITWLAIARLGAVMIPVNTRYTSRELTYVLDDGEADFLVVDAAYWPVVTAARAALPRLDDRHVIVHGTGITGHPAWSELADGPDIFHAAEPVGHDDLLNIQYTSGTTGFPKGCMLAQLYWLVLGRVNARRDGLVYQRIFSATPFFYMDPQWLLLMAMNQRTTLVVAPRQSGSHFLSWLREYDANFCLLPNVLPKQPATPHDRDHQVLRANIYGFPPADHAALEERFDLVAREAFGMTEVGSAMFMPIEAVDMVGSGACGMPSPYRECRVADMQGNTLPPGEIGELLVRGPGILRGYYRKPEQTAAAFHGDWFRTGDLFRMDARGYFTIVGRVKDMIRRAGENIAAREVEAVVCGIAEIAEAAALPVPDDTRGEEVKIYVVLKSDVTPDTLPPEAIIAHCQRGLASFKVPRYIEYCDALPKTASEKIAKHMLVAAKPDLRAGSWDRVVSAWI